MAFSQNHNEIHYSPCEGLLGDHFTNNAWRVITWWKCRVCNTDWIVGNSHRFPILTTAGNVAFLLRLKTHPFITQTYVNTHNFLRTEIFPSWPPRSVIIFSLQALFLKFRIYFRLSQVPYIFLPPHLHLMAATLICFHSKRPRTLTFLTESVNFPEIRVSQLLSIPLKSLLFPLSGYLASWTKGQVEKLKTLCSQLLVANIQKNRMDFQ